MSKPRLSELPDFLPIGKPGSAEDAGARMLGEGKAVK